MSTMTDRLEDQLRFDGKQYTMEEVLANAALRSRLLDRIEEDTKAGDAILFDYGPSMPSEARATLARSQETLHLVVAALRSLHLNGGNPWGPSKA